MNQGRGAQPPAACPGLAAPLSAGACALEDQCRAQLEALERQLALKEDEVGSWQVRALEERARSEDQARQLELAAVVLARLELQVEVEKVRGGILGGWGGGLWPGWAAGL